MTKWHHLYSNGKPPPCQRANIILVPKEACGKSPFGLDAMAVHPGNGQVYPVTELQTCFDEWDRRK